MANNHTGIGAVPSADGNTVTIVENNSNVVNVLSNSSATGIFALSVLHPSLPLIFMVSKEPVIFADGFEKEVYRVVVKNINDTTNSVVAYVDLEPEFGSLGVPIESMIVTENHLIVGTNKVLVWPIPANLNVQPPADVNNIPHYQLERLNFFKQSYTSSNTPAEAFGTVAFDMDVSNDGNIVYVATGEKILAFDLRRMQGDPAQQIPKGSELIAEADATLTNADEYLNVSVGPDDRVYTIHVDKNGSGNSLNEDDVIATSYDTNLTEASKINQTIVTFDQNQLAASLAAFGVDLGPTPEQLADISNPPNTPGIVDFSIFITMGNDQIYVLNPASGSTLQVQLCSQDDTAALVTNGIAVFEDADGALHSMLVMGASFQPMLVPADSGTLEILTGNTTPDQCPINSLVVNPGTSAGNVSTNGAGVVPISVASCGSQNCTLEPDQVKNLVVSDTLRDFSITTTGTAEPWTFTITNNSADSVQFTDIGLDGNSSPAFAMGDNTASDSCTMFTATKGAALPSQNSCTLNVLFTIPEDSTGNCDRYAGTINMLYALNTQTNDSLTANRAVNFTARVGDSCQTQGQNGEIPGTDFGPGNRNNDSGNNTTINFASGGGSLHWAWLLGLAGLWALRRKSL